MGAQNLPEVKLWCQHKLGAACPQRPPRRGKHGRGGREELELSYWSRPIWTWSPCNLHLQGSRFFRQGTPPPTARSRRLGATVLTHTRPREVEMPGAPGSCQALLLARAPHHHILSPSPMLIWGDTPSTCWDPLPRLDLGLPLTGWVGRLGHQHARGSSPPAA